MGYNVFFIECIKLFIKFVLVDLPRQIKLFVTPVIYKNRFLSIQKKSVRAVSPYNLLISVSHRVQITLH